jgi:hypothetical protein
MPFNSLFAWFIKKRIHQIDLFRKYPNEVQYELFLKLLSNAKDTKWGLKYEYQEIKSIKDYQDSVPLQDYDAIKPWVDRMFAGEQNVLWPTPIKWFAKSSGTTSFRSKIIPVSPESLEECHFLAGRDLIALYYDNYENANLYSGKYLVVGGSADENSNFADSYSGDLSAIIMKNLPWWAEVRRTPSKDIALMADWEQKVDKIARTTMNEDVHLMTGVPSWTMVILQRILEISGKNDITEVWPNLELFMHGGVSFDPYHEQFKNLIPKSSMNYLESYNATEGFFGIQDQKDSNDLLLMLDYGIFYEFIPMNAYDGVHSKIIVALSEIEVGQNYALVISTNAGLWRYIVGDTVSFTSTLPYRFKITGRTKSFINSCGEEIIVENADKAISNACLLHNASVRDYTAAPIYMKQSEGGAHEWLIEFTKKPENLAKFTASLDQELRVINSDYDAKRSHERALKMPHLHMLENGTFEAWMKKNGKLGGQHKIPRLNNNRDFLNQILEFESFYK